MKLFHILDGFSTKNYISNNYESQVGYIGNNIYKKYVNRIFNNTNNITKHINNYSNDVTNNYKMNKIQNLKKTYHNFNDGITLSKTSNNYSNGTYTIINTNNTFNATDNNYYIKKPIIQVISLITLHDITITNMSIM